MYQARKIEKGNLLLQASLDYIDSVSKINIIKISVSEGHNRCI